jgi:RNA polymerase sigma-70 factor (ECF subfamily)
VATQGGHTDPRATLTAHNMGFVTSDILTPELIASIRAGDRGAFEGLFRTWYARLADYAFRISGSRDGAEDAVQDVFIAVWQRRASIPDAPKLPAYLHRAVRNRVLNQIRDITTADRVATQIGIEPGEAPHADASVLEGELRDAIASALAELPPRTREVFELSREQGLTYQQIADTLEISVKTVETLMGRGLRVLRERLKK